jgi:hypothetical protein
MGTKEKEKRKMMMSFLRRIARAASSGSSKLRVASGSAEHIT